MFLSFFLNVEKIVLNESMAAKMASRVSYLVYYYCKQSEFEILRCCSESIPMKVSDLPICIIKMMWRDLKKKKCLSRFRDIQKRAKSPNFEWSCTYTVGEKTGWFQGRMNENTPIIFVASKYDNNYTL